MNITKKLTAAAAIALLAGSAQALTCGGPTGTRTVTVDPAAACTLTGLGNLGDTALNLLLPGSVIERDTGNNNGGLLNITGVGGSSGTWSLSGAFSPVYLYFHFGNGSPFNPAFNPDWFIVRLDPNLTSGTWSVNPGQLALSNIAAIGIPGSSGNTPEPSTASLALLGLGLLGVGFGLRRRKTS